MEFYLDFNSLSGTVLRVFPPLLELIELLKEPDSTVPRSNSPESVIFIGISKYNSRFLARFSYLLSLGSYLKVDSFLVTSV